MFKPNTLIKFLKKKIKEEEETEEMEMEIEIRGGK